MDAVCAGKKWDVALVEDAGGRVCAAMPYLLGRRWGMSYVLQPQLTQWGGPWFGSSADRLEVSRQLAQRFRQAGLLFFAQSFGHDMDSMPRWEGFDYSERVTYRIDDIGNLEQVFEGFDRQRRQRPIRRAERVLATVEGIEPEEFARFHARYWASRGRRDVLSEEFITRIVSTALARGQGLLMGVADETGRLHAARFVAFDSHSAYALLSALNPEGHHNGASPLLFWRMMERLSTRTRAFDFEGSMDPGIAFSYSLYGARPVGYQHVTRHRNRAVKRLLPLLGINI